ncbi:MAG: 5-formyltetrahydrofolate cyclo-ligase [Bacteroidetes bacterium]|nr:5-formyltetrahydrofolate cyclo-ligase [Bacteroidota bacterium]
MTKQELRTRYLQERKNIAPKLKLQYDDLMLLQFQQFNFNTIKSVLTYWGMQQNNEPNTHLFSSYLRHILPNLQIAYPVSNFITNEMKAILIDEETVYRTNEYGITEPKFGKEIKANEIDLVLVPMIICDTEGYRVGYGKGFYDKFLAECSKNIITIGFSYFEPINKIDDVNEFDIPLCCCITPNTIYEF